MAFSLQFGLSNLHLKVFTSKLNLRFTYCCLFWAALEAVVLWAHITQAVNSKKLILWFCCSFGSARPLANSLPSFWVTLDGEVLTDTLNFFPNLSVGQTYIFKCCDGLSLLHFYSHHYNRNTLLSAVQYFSDTAHGGRGPRGYFSTTFI